MFVVFDGLFIDLIIPFALEPVILSLLSSSLMMTKNQRSIFHIFIFSGISHQSVQLLPGFCSANLFPSPRFAERCFFCVRQILGRTIRKKNIRKTIFK